MVRPGENGGADLWDNTLAAWVDFQAARPHAAARVYIVAEQCRSWTPRTVADVDPTSWLDCVSIRPHGLIVSRQASLMAWMCVDPHGLIVCAGVDPTSWLVG